MSELLCVHPDHVPLVWPAVRDLLRAAYLKNDLTHTDALERDVLSGKGVLWMASTNGAIDAAAVTVLTRTDANLACVITAVGGSNRGRWLHMLSEIEAWAKSEGAGKVRIYGRKGWVRVLEKYRVSSVVLERQL